MIMAGGELAGRDDDGNMLYLGLKWRIRNEGSRQKVVADGQAAGLREKRFPISTNRMLADVTQSPASQGSTPAGTSDTRRQA